MNLSKRKVTPKIYPSDLQPWEVVAVTGLATDLAKLEVYEGKKFNSNDKQYSIAIEYHTAQGSQVVTHLKADTEAEIGDSFDKWVNQVQRQLATVEQDPSIVLNTPHHLQKVPFITSDGEVAYTFSPVLKEQPEE